MIQVEVGFHCFELVMFKTSAHPFAFAISGMIRLFFVALKGYKYNSFLIWPIILGQEEGAKWRELEGGLISGVRETVAPKSIGYYLRRRSKQLRSGIFVLFGVGSWGILWSFVRATFSRIKLKDSNNVQSALKCIITTV